MPQQFPLSGHFGAVSDLSWDPSGSYLLSTSIDKTTRVFIPYKKGKEEGTETFVEIARPQIHGHDLTCVASVSRFFLEISMFILFYLIYILFLFLYFNKKSSQNYAE